MLQNEEKGNEKRTMNKVMIQGITVPISLNVSTPIQKHCLIRQKKQMQIYATKVLGI